MIYRIPDNSRDYWNVGRHSERPVRICANINSRSFGDFTMGLFCAQTVAEQFDHSVVTLIYKDDMDFKRDVVRLVPGSVLVRTPSEGALPSLELFNCSNPVIDKSLAAWFEAGMNEQHIYITESMANDRMLFCNEDLGYLRFPEDSVAACSEQLVARGMKPDGWFCAMHAREPSYQGKPDGPNFRDCDPETFLAAAIHIIRTLGGQVVRLGHPQMTPFAPMEGLIDLSREEGNSLLQLFAISRSRFVLAGPSGPTAVADCLHVPNALANAVNYYFFNDRIVVRTVDVHTPDGKLLRQAELAEAGMDKLFLMKAQRKGYRVVQNSAAELIRLATYIHDLTTDTQGWRSPDPPRTAPRKKQFIWPGVPKLRGQFLPVSPG